MIKRLISGCLTGILFVLTMLAIAAGFMWHEQWVQVTQVKVESNSLPVQWEGTRIGLISDLHIGSRMNYERVAGIVRHLNAQKPDFVIIAGDTVDSEMRKVDQVAPTIEALRHINAPLGVYLVFGNHDSLNASLWRSLYQKVGLRVLENQHTRLDRAGAKLYVVGLADAFHRKMNAHQAWQGIPAGSTVIAAVHEPDVADRLSGRPLLLQLSGHSHGGQVRIPFRPLVLPPLGSRYPAGLARTETGHLIYTTRGIGTSQIPFRLFARPEITIITLRKSAANQ